MYEGDINWEKWLTVLLGIVIVASVYLIIYKRKRSKRKRLEREAGLLKSNQQIKNQERNIPE